MPLDTEAMRSHFPIFSQKIDGGPLVYLDTAATAQKPQCVLDAVNKYYKEDSANINRGMHVLAERATEKYEAARKRVQQFLHARSAREIIFTKNSTESINLVARSWGEANLQKGDTVLVSMLEHHSNIVPWLQLKEKIGIELAWIAVHEDGTLDMEDYQKKLETCNAKLVAITCVSNVLGVVTPYKHITQLAHAQGALVLLDAAQLAPHAPIDVQEIDCDFLVFSGYKIYAPTGIGVLYGKETLLDAMPPFMGGGGMIQEVYTDHFTPTHLPEKFEAGTPPIAQAIGLHSALDWLEELGWEDIIEHDRAVLQYALEKLHDLPYVDVLGPNDISKMMSCTAFVIETIHPHDLTEYMGRKGVCLRAGHHCAQPLHDYLQNSATTRVSVGVYNTKEDIERMCEVMEEAYGFFNPS